VSRIAMGKATLHREVFDLAELVRRVLTTWRDAGRLPDDQVTVDAEPVWIDADRTRIEQIFSNVLDNAVKFTPREMPIRLSVVRIGDSARLTVSDDGIGIPAADLPHVFELFVQGPQDLSRKRGGMGVGLALVKRLVQMHGGSVVAQSEGPGRGVTITIDLPAVTAPVEPPKTDPGRGSTGSPLRILVVEDNDDARATLEALLRVLGHEVRAAADGESGLAEAVRFRPDIAFVDIGLPDFDGYEFVRRIRAMPQLSDVRTVALTGYGQPADRERAVAVGFDHHVTKPIPTENADDLVRSLCRPRAA
jgi:CheY-like chemotaxis protein/anti-sigma regulatory factor (Ser/Thr protein kinase)